MTNPAEIVRSFYDKLRAGDAAGALGLMARDIEWITMWHYKVNGRGPERVAEGLFKPLMAEWSSFALEPTEFIVDGDLVVSLGRFIGVHGTTGKQAEARYAHVWTVKDGKIASFRQYIDTLAIAEARRSASLPPLPPFSQESAIQKVRAAEDAWNMRDPVRVALCLYSRQSLVIKELWTFVGNRIAVRFAYEHHDDSGQWFRTYGNENWQFDAAGLIELRYASINEHPIAETNANFAGRLVAVPTITGG